MDTAKVNERRQKAIDFHKSHEGVPESPLHPRHPNMKDAEGNSKTLHSQRPVAVLDDEDVYFAAADVPAVLEGLREWLDKTDKAGDAITRYAETVAKKVIDAGANLSGDDVLQLSTRQYNAVLHALGEVGVLVVSCDLKG